jgi:hypothetical protein
MELTFIGYLKSEKNKGFSVDGATLGKNDISELVISLVESEIKKISNLIEQYNPSDKPIEYHYSFPVAFERTPNGPECHVKCVIRAAKPDSLMKKIDWTSSLLKKPLQAWIGSELAITVKVIRYNFNVAPSNADTTLIEGGAQQKLRGLSFQIQSVKLASEVPQK